MFTDNKRNTRKRCEICSNLTIKHLNDVNDTALVFLLLTLKIFHTFFLLTLKKQIFVRNCILYKALHNFSFCWQCVNYNYIFLRIIFQLFFCYCCVNVRVCLFSANNSSIQIMAISLMYQCIFNRKHGIFHNHIFL